MNLQNYIEHKRTLYERFSKIVKGIVSTAIKISDYPYRLQQIQHRAKNIESLERKLKSKGILNANALEDTIKDLAGCRVIFYFNDDVNAFIRSGLVSDNFMVHWAKSNIHYPKNKPTSANEYYTAIHYVVELKKDRCALPEYAEYKGLMCEIQVQTVLDHAWAATAHDITYKKDQLSGFGSKLFTSIDDRLQNVMTDYLRPAGYEFQKIQRDFQRLIEGKGLFDRNITQDIGKGIDNNKRHEVLERYKEYVLPHYDDIHGELNEILNIVNIAINSSGVQATPIDTPFGALPGKTPEHILEICLDILKFVRYVDITRVFLVLTELYAKTTKEEERSKIINIVESLAKYNLNICSSYGTYVQTTLLSIISKWDFDQLCGLKGIVLSVCRSVLEPTAEGTSSTYKTFTFTRANLNGTDELASIRNNALNFLQKIYRCNENKLETDRRNVILALNQATRIPHSGTYDDSLREIILKNTKGVVDFYITSLPDEHYEILEDLENSALSLFKRAQNNISNPDTSENIKERSRSLLESIVQFRNELNNNNSFIIYKTLIGFNSVFPEEWNNEEWTFEEKDKYRESKLYEYARSIDRKSSKYWEKLLLKCSQTQSSDLATFPHFVKFLNLLAKIKPNFILYMLHKHEKEMATFLSTILDGLLQGSAKNKVKPMIRTWIASGKHLFSCARVFEFNAQLGKEMLKEIGKKAKAQKDTSTLNQILVGIVENYSDDCKAFKELFFPTLEELTKNGNSHWIDAIWYRKKSEHIFSEVTESECDIILHNLLLRDSIDIHAETILVPIARKYPEKIIKFFGLRLKRKETIQGKNRYEAIPHIFHKLAEPLSKIPRKILQIVSSWHTKSYYIFINRGANLVKCIYPTFPELFEKELLRLIRTKKRKKLPTVKAILRNYEGEPFLHKVCKEIVKVVRKGGKDLAEIETILQTTGMVSGEFGLSEAYERKKKEMDHWFQDKDKKVKAFVKQYTAYLDRQIASERRRAEENVELRKLDYGV